MMTSLHHCYLYTSISLTDTLSSLAEKGLCLYCCTLLGEGMECGDVEKITGPHPPCNGLNAQWKCNLCLTTVYTQDILRIKKLRLLYNVMYDFFQSLQSY